MYEPAPPFRLLRLQMPAAHQQPGGFPVDYQAKQASFDLANPEDLYWLTECWVAERRGVSPESLGEALVASYDRFTSTASGGPLHAGAQQVG